MNQSIEQLLATLSVTSWKFLVGQIAIIVFVLCGLCLSTLTGLNEWRGKGKGRRKEEEDTLKQSKISTSIQSESSRDLSQIALTPSKSLSGDDLDSLPLSLEAAVKFRKNGEVTDFVRFVGRHPGAQERYIRLLSCAVLENNEFIVRFLLENAINRPHPNLDLEHLLWLSVNSGYLGLAKILLTYIPVPSDIVKDLVEHAVREDYLPLLDSLWPVYFDANFPGKDDILWEAAYLGHIDIVCFLTSRACTDQHSLDLSLHAAVLNCHVELVKLLLDYGADASPSRYIIPESSNSLLHTAAANANTAIVTMLLDRGADLHLEEENKAGPLQVALHAMNNPVYELLRSRGADELAIPLSTAVHARHKRLIVKLLNRGAQAMQYCGMFGSLLQMVCAKGDEEMARFLIISCGFSVNPDSPIGLGGNSPLMAAVSSGNHNRKLVELLINQGASMQRARSEFGNALQTAVFWGYMDIVRVLLENFFDVQSRCGHLPDALTIAVRRRNRDIASLLLQKGASTRGLETFDRDALIQMMK